MVAGFYRKWGGDSGAGSSSLASDEEYSTTFDDDEGDSLSNNEDDTGSESTGGVVETTIPIFGSMFSCVGAVGDFIHEETIEFKDDFRNDYSTDPRCEEIHRWTLEGDDESENSLSLADSGMEVTVPTNTADSISTDISSSEESSCLDSELESEDETRPKAEARTEKNDKKGKGLGDSLNIRWVNWMNSNRSSLSRSMGTFDGECASPVVSFGNLGSSRSFDKMKPARLGVPILVPTKSWEGEQRVLPPEMAAIQAEKTNEPDVPTRMFHSQQWMLATTPKSKSSMELSLALSDEGMKRSSKKGPWRRLKTLTRRPKGKKN